MESSQSKSSYQFYCFTKCFHSPSNFSLEMEKQDNNNNNNNNTKMKKKKPGGWRAMPFILGNETFERLATFGLLANFMVYLMKEFGMEQVYAANIINIWSGITNFAPLVGAFISDAYLGRFRTIAFASCAALLGMVTVTLTAWLPNLHPRCHNDQCENATSAQLTVLLMGLGLLSIGTGGIRPCSIPFGVDQFDPTTPQGAKGIASFYNWYYTTFTVVILITLTVVVYIQDSISWVVGFAIPTGLMLCAIVLFFCGTSIYVHVKAQGSIFSGIFRVFVAAYHKRRVKLPDFDDFDVSSVFYDPPVENTDIRSKLPLTNQYRFLNRGAIVQKNDLNPDGSCTNPWKLCTIQQVEEVKSLFKMGPIWASGIICFTAMTQQGTFTVSQALKMDRHVGPKFQIPAGSMAVFSMLTIGLWLPFYDRILVPSLRKITNRPEGITLLQRIGIGIVFSVLSMVLAGLVEKARRDRASLYPGSTISVLWLLPQLVTMGFCEAFACIGHIELYNREFPDHMRSIANSLFFCSFAGANYLSSFIVTLVHGFTGSRGQLDWLTSDLNAGKLDYFYFLLAGIGGLNLGYFLFCSYHYRYKTTIGVVEDVELSLNKKVAPS